MVGRHGSTVATPSGSSRRDQIYVRLNPHDELNPRTRVLKESSVRVQDGVVVLVLRRKQTHLLHVSSDPTVAHTLAHTLEPLKALKFLCLLCHFFSSHRRRVSGVLECFMSRYKTFMLVKKPRDDIGLERGQDRKM